MASLIGNNIRTIGCTWLPKMSTYSLAVMWPFRVIIGTVEYWCCPNHHRSASMFHSWNQAFRIIGFLGNSAGINLAWCWEQCEGQLIWPWYIFPVIRHPGFMIIHHLFHLLTLFSVISGLANATLQWILDLWRSCQIVFVETVSSRWILSFLSPLLQ